MFVFCEFGEGVRAQFEQVDELIYECDWYEFPLEIQRILPTVFLLGQQPVLLKGFANLICTREAFKKVDQNQFDRIE